MAWVRFVLWWMPYSCGFEACLNPTCEGVYVTAWINKCIKSGGETALRTYWAHTELWFCPLTRVKMDGNFSDWRWALPSCVVVLRWLPKCHRATPDNHDFTSISLIIEVFGIWGGKKMRTLCFPFYSHQDVGSPPSISWSSSSSVNFGILVGKLRQACAFEPLNSADERSRDHT